MKRGQYTYDQVVNQLKYEMSQDSSYSKRLELATRFSDFIYNERWHNLCLDNQIFCANRVMELFNLSADQATRLQQDIVRAYKIADNMLDAHEMIQQHHLIASGQIDQQLSQVQNPSPAPTGRDVVIYNSKEKNPVEPRQNNAMAEFINAARTSDIASSTKSVAFINCDIQDFDITAFYQMFKWQSWNLHTLSFAGNKIKSPSWILTAYDFANTTGNGTSIMHIDLSDNRGFGDVAARFMALELQKGNMPALKVLDVHGSSMTKTGYGYFAKALDKINQSLAIVFTKAQEVSKQAFKQTIKSMLYIAKQNGITTKEMLTTDETIEHCKKGTFNVAKNIAGGFIKCFTSASTPIAVYEMDMHSLLVRCYN